MNVLEVREPRVVQDLLQGWSLVSVLFEKSLAKIFTFFRYVLPGMEVEISLIVDGLSCDFPIIFVIKW